MTLRNSNWSCDNELWFDQLRMPDGRTLRDHCNDHSPNSHYITIGFQSPMYEHPLPLPKPDLAPRGWRLN
jgi:hypothetical protein